MAKKIKLDPCPNCEGVMVMIRNPTNSYAECTTPGCLCRFKPQRSLAAAIRLANNRTHHSERS